MATILLDTLKSHLTPQPISCDDEPIDQVPYIAEPCELLKPDVCSGNFVNYTEFTIEEYLALLDACLEATVAPEVEINATTKNSLTFPGSRYEKANDIYVVQIYAPSCGNCEVEDDEHFCYSLLSLSWYDRIDPVIQTLSIPRVTFDSETDTFTYLPTVNCYLPLGMSAYLTDRVSLAEFLYFEGACDAHNSESVSAFTNLEDCSCSDEDLGYGFEGSLSSVSMNIGVSLYLSSIFLDTPTWEDAATVHVPFYVSVYGYVSSTVGTGAYGAVAYDSLAASVSSWATTDEGEMPYLTPVQDGSANITIRYSGGEIVKNKTMSYVWFPDEEAIDVAAVEPAFAGAVNPGSPFVSDIIASITII